MVQFHLFSLISFFLMLFFLWVWKPHFLDFIINKKINLLLKRYENWKNLYSSNKEIAPNLLT